MHAGMHARTQACIKKNKKSISNVYGIAWNYMLASFRHCGTLSCHTPGHALLSCVSVTEAHNSHIVLIIANLYEYFIPTETFVKYCILFQQKLLSNIVFYSNRNDRKKRVLN